MVKCFGRIPLIFLSILLANICCAASAATTDEKMKTVEEMFNSPYTEEMYYRADSLLLTATGSLQPVHRAPAVASVITAEDIEKMGATDLSQVLETVPGLHVTPSFNRLNSNFAIRGILTGTNAEVLVLMNGIPLTQTTHGIRVSTFRLPVANISRVEVIRGPGSAVYGADAFAGVINIITKDAQEIGAFKGGFRAGSFDTYDFWAQHGGTYGGWNVALSVEEQQSHGDRDRIVSTDLQTSLDKAFGTRASHAPGSMDTNFKIWNSHLELARENWTARLWGWAQDDAGIGVGTTNVLDSRSKQDAGQYLADLTYQNKELLRDTDLSLRLSYMYIEDDPFFLLFPAGTVLPIGSDGNPFTAGGGLVSFPDGVIGHPNAVEQHYSVDFTTFYTGFDQHRVRVGTGLTLFDANFEESKNFGPGIIDGEQPVVGGTLTNVSDTQFVFLEDHSRDLFYLSLQDEWAFARNWHLTAGVRYDHFSDFGDTIDPRVALVWEPRYDLTTKLLYGRAFRPPSFAELFLKNNPSALGNPDLKPETIQTLELAFDYQPVSNLHTILNVFGFEIRNLIEYVQDAESSDLRAQNAASQQGYGFELETDWKVTDTFRLRANFTFQRSMDKKTGHRVPDAPGMEFYVNPHWAFLPDWSIDGQLFWVGDRKRADGDTRPEIADYTTVNLTLRRKNIAKHWDVALGVRNLFNEDIREPSPSAVLHDFPMAGRSILGEVRMSF